MHTVKAFFIKNKKHDHDASGDSNRQTKNIDCGKSLVLPQVP
jgi:hypothetical protein